jgi:multidrug efflux pump subunit AcrA (membrane-fusion protein)
MSDENLNGPAIFPSEVFPQKDTFSKEALDRLRSPEHLDFLLTVTQPVAWMSLFALFLLTGAIVVWGVFGVISESVEAVGMIIDPAGIATITHTSGGRVTELLVRPGNRVKKGTVVAKIHADTLRDNVVTTSLGLSNSGSVQQVFGNLVNLDLAAAKLDRQTSVVSLYDGVVTELQVNVGDIVTAGSSPICSVRLDQNRNDLLAMLYLPLQSAKRVKPGMVARIAPSEVDASETGFLMGVVRETSEYPISTAGMMRYLGNAAVANWILNQTQGAAVEAKVDLVREEKSRSGYLWSSVVSDPPALSAGGACTAEIVVERAAPIDKAFFKISQWLR